MRTEAGQDRPRRLNPIKQKQMEERCAFLEEEVPRIEAAIAHTEEQLGVYVSAAETAAPDHAGRGAARAVGRAYRRVGRADDAVGRPGGPHLIRVRRKNLLLSATSVYDRCDSEIQQPPQWSDAMLIIREPACFSRLRSHSRIKASTISLPSVSVTASIGVRPPRAGIFW